MFLGYILPFHFLFLVYHKKEVILPAMLFQLFSLSLSDFIFSINFNSFSDCFDHIPVSYPLLPCHYAQCSFPYHLPLLSDHSVGQWSRSYSPKNLFVVNLLLAFLVATMKSTNSVNASPYQSSYLRNADPASLF